VQEPTYNQDGSYAVTEIRSQDNKDRWLVKLNLERGSFEELDYQHDLDRWSWYSIMMLLEHLVFLEQ
jgi:hypothetical protein